MWTPPQAAPAAEVRDCGDVHQGLFYRLRDWAVSTPALALECAAWLPNDDQRDYIRRLAFASAMRGDLTTAARYLPDVIDRPWVTDAGFFPSLALARLADVPRLLMAAARKSPSVALREVSTYKALRYGQEAFDEAATAAPDESVGLASGGSDVAAAVLDALRASARPELQVLAQLAADTARPVLDRERIAVFFRQIARYEMTIDQASRLSGDEVFFPALVERRLRANPAEAPSLDRILERTAQKIFRAFEDHAPYISRLSAQDLYLLLTFGRSEEDDSLFTGIFDRLLAPKLRAGRSISYLRVRTFLALAAEHQRLDAFLAASGKPNLLAESMRSVESLDEALEAAAIIDAVSGPVRLEQLRAGLDSSGPGATLRGLLGVRLSEKLHGVESRYRIYFKETKRLETATLFDSTGLCVQRHFFYNDDDGIESFESFKKHYLADPTWRFEQSGDFAHVLGTGVNGRNIEIYANLPTRDSQPAISRILAGRHLEPRVFVHRGHAYHVEHSLQYLTASPRLIYLGSCRSLGVTAEAIGRATRAQIITTRGVGTLQVNDPVLKSINDELLRGAKTIEWPAFWQSQAAKIGPPFYGYTGPHQNAVAAFIAAYYEYLSSETLAAEAVH